MLKPFRNPEKKVRTITLVTISFMLCYGLVVVLAQIKPFWVDEWRVIYNLKYKSITELWGPLDYMQQFPRLYLTLVKLFTAPFDYSYFSLRFPSFMVETVTIILCYSLMNKIYPANFLNRFLFVLILLSSYPSTEYFVQIKQYTMDILLSLIAIWQLINLLSPQLQVNKRYFLLCLSFLIAPFFSYTYPIAIAPAYIIVISLSFIQIKQKSLWNRKLFFYRLLPLLLCFISIVVFYFVDVYQVLADKGMQEFWGKKMMKDGFSILFFLDNVYKLFAQVGSGDFFEIVFGVVGLTAFIGVSINYIKTHANDLNSYLKLYSILLLLLTIGLFAAKKLPIESRLNAYTVPSIAILIIFWLQRLKSIAKWRLTNILSVILYVGVIGNIFTSITTEFLSDDYNRKMNIYVSTENAIIFAQQKHLPIFITPAVAFPYEHTLNYPFRTTIPGDWVLKTFPAYKVDKDLPVYPIHHKQNIQKHLRSLPSSITEVLLGDGQQFKVVKREF